MTLQHFGGCTHTSAQYRVYDTENLERHTACALLSSQKNGQIDPDIEFEEYMQGHD